MFSTCGLAVMPHVFAATLWQGHTSNATVVHDSLFGVRAAPAGRMQFEVPELTEMLVHELVSGQQLIWEAPYCAVCLLAAFPRSELSVNAEQHHLRSITPSNHASGNQRHSESS